MDFFDCNAHFGLPTHRPLAPAALAQELRYHPDRVDYHVYPHWIPIVNQRPWTAGGGPWRWARRPVNYSPDECPRSLDLLSRAVHLDVNPLLSSSEIEETIEGVNKVLTALA